jgi:addiction module RelB/DinJ family antitoxin
MAKTNNLHIRIDPAIQQKADKVLKGLGMSIPDAVTVFLKQVILKGGIPFEIKHPQKNNNPLSTRYCYGVFMDDVSKAPDEWFSSFRKRLTPEFGKEIDEWLTQEKAKRQQESESKEPYSWLAIFKQAVNGASFDTFEKLFKDKGLHLIHCYSNRHDSKPCFPFALGFFLDKVDERLVFNGQKPRMYRVMEEKILTVFSKIEQEDLQIWGVSDEETEDLFSNA